MSNPTQPPHDSGSGERAARDALAELVVLKDLKERVDGLIDEADATNGPQIRERNSLVNEYLRRKPLAWAAARAALATPSQAPEPIAPERPSTAEWLYCVDTLWEKARGDMPDGMCGWFQARKFAALLENEMGRADSEPATPSQAVASALQAWQPANTRPYQGTYLVKNASGQVAPWINGLIHNNVGTDNDWLYGEAITGWMPLPLADAVPAHPVVQPGIQGDGHQAGASLLLACDSTESGSQPHASDVECWEKGAPDSIDRAMVAESAEDPAALFAQANCLGVAAQVSGDAAMAAQAKSLYLRAKQIEARATLSSKPSPSSAGVPLPGASGQDETKAPACRTCNDSGVIGRHMQDGSWDSAPCPDCSIDPTHHTGTAGSTTPATPELSIDQDGEIAFDWASETNGVRDLLSISLGEDGRLSFAFMIGERKGSGTIYAKLPPVLFEAIKHFAAEPEESSSTSGSGVSVEAREQSSDRASS